MKPRVWPTVKLGEVLRQRKEFITIDDSQTYRRCRVQLHAQGVVERDSVAGFSIKTKEQQMCRAGEFLVAEIDAKVGGYGIVPNGLDGSVVSSHYFLFVPDERRLDRRFLHWFVRTPLFSDQVTAQGSTNYAAIRPQQILGYHLPLPPLAEQCRLADRIEEIEVRLSQAVRENVGSVMEGALLCRSAVSDTLDTGAWREQPLNDLLSENTLNGISARPHATAGELPILRISAVTSRPDGLVDEDDVRFLPSDQTLLERYRLNPGDLLACRFNGNLSFVGRFALFRGYASPQRVFPDKLIRFRFAIERVLPEFVRYAVSTRKRRIAIESLTATTAGNIGISAATLKTIRLPVPPITEQRRIVEYLDAFQVKVDALKARQAQIAAELDALLPSILDKAFRGEL